METRTNKIAVGNPLNHIKGMIPPQHIELEESVLGTAMSQSDVVNTLMEILNEDCFYKNEHRLIFKAMKSLYLKRSSVDFLTIAAELRKTGELDFAGGNFYVTNLTNKTTNSGNIETHCYLIKESYYKREIIKIGSNAVSQAYLDTSDPFDLVENITKVYDVISAEVGKSIRPVGNIVLERLKAYEQIIESGITGVPSGYKDLDRITSGWQDTDLIIVAGRPAMGKTAFVVNCARNASVDFKKPGIIFSLEMSEAQLVDRLISAEAEVDGDTLKKRQFSDQEWQKIGTASSVIHEAPLYIDDTPALSIVQFTAKANKAKRDHDIQWIIIDYLQLMRGTKEKGASTNREQEISSISRALKAVAKDLGIPVIALSQLSRAVETRPGHLKRPRLSDLRESGSIEQDADVVIFLFRPEYYGMTEDEQGRSLAGVGEVIVAKHRNGNTDTAVLRFIGKYTKFLDLEDTFETLVPQNPTAGIRPSNYYDREDDDDDTPF